MYDSKDGIRYQHVLFLAFVSNLDCVQWKSPQWESSSMKTSEKRAMFVWIVYENFVDSFFGTFAKLENWVSWYVGHSKSQKIKQSKLWCFGCKTCENYANWLFGTFESLRKTMQIGQLLSYCLHHWPNFIIIPLLTNL